MFADIAARDGAGALLAGCVFAVKGNAVCAAVAAVFAIGHGIDAAPGAFDLTFRATAIVNAIHFTAGAAIPEDAAGSTGAIIGCSAAGIEGSGVNSFSVAGERVT